MWQWQVHFMISCKVTAESLFGLIDDRLQATSFLIGFRINGDGNKEPICYEPEKMFFLQQDLDQIERLAVEFINHDPHRDINYSDGMQEEMNDRRKNRNFREALKKALDDSQSFKDKIKLG